VGSVYNARMSISTKKRAVASGCLVGHSGPVNRAFWKVRGSTPYGYHSPFCLSTLVVAQCLTTALTLSPAPVDSQGDLHIFLVNIPVFACILIHLFDGVESVMYRYTVCCINYIRALRGSKKEVIVSVESLGIYDGKFDDSRRLFPSVIVSTQHHSAVRSARVMISIHSYF
jgi:hypothetical protein